MYLLDKISAIKNERKGDVIHSATLYGLVLGPILQGLTLENRLQVDWV